MPPQGQFWGSALSRKDGYLAVRSFFLGKIIVFYYIGSISLKGRSKFHRLWQHGCHVFLKRFLLLIFFILPLETVGFGGEKALEKSQRRHRTL